jgi:hypothetical protein
MLVNMGPLVFMKVKLLFLERILKLAKLFNIWLIRAGIYRKIDFL